MTHFCNQSENSFRTSSWLVHSYVSIPTVARMSDHWNTDGCRSSFTVTQCSSFGHLHPTEESWQISSGSGFFRNGSSTNGYHFNHDDASSLQSTFAYPSSPNYFDYERQFPSKESGQQTPQSDIRELYDFDDDATIPNALDTNDYSSASASVASVACTSSEPFFRDTPRKSSKVTNEKKFRKHYSVEKRYRTSLNEKFNQLQTRMQETKRKRSTEDDGSEVGVEHNRTENFESLSGSSKQSRSQVLINAIAYIDELEELVQEKDLKIKQLRGSIHTSKLVLENVLK
ncbi:hypothetical protein B0J14DRAFT_576490 [Halenospora varia]|nr:hypothetical protein B0J14DRAFT_576490 [Halenospora varia]